MRDRRDSDTNQYPTVSGGRSDTTQRNLFIGVGGFVIAFLVIGILLLSGGDDGDDEDSGALATNTRSATELAAGASETAVGEGEPTIAQTSTTPGATVDPAQAAATATPGRVIPTVTPSNAVAEATEDLTSEATEEPTDEEPEATEDPGDGDAEPTEEPIVGDFGQLPPIQIVSGGLEGDVDIEFVLDAASFSAPEIAPVYEIDWQLWDADELAAIAANLGIEAEVEDNSADNYQVSGIDAQLFAGPTASGPPILQYESLLERLDEPLPDDSTLIELGYAFLVDSGITPDAGDGVVVGRDDNAGVAIVEYKPVEPSPLLAALPAATVTFGPGGVVEKADVRWPAGYAVSDYGLRSTSAMWNDVLAGEASMEADLSAVPAGATAGTFTVTDIGTAYSLAGLDYLAPLVVFYGDLYFSDVDMTVPMRIYVQAVAGQDTPAG